MNPVAHVFGKCFGCLHSLQTRSTINSQVLAKLHLRSESAEITESGLEMSREKSFGASDLTITYPFQIIIEIFEVYWLGIFYMVTLGNDWVK